MLGIRINGSEAPISTGHLVKITEVVELIKSSIDPEHMITSVRVNGKELSSEEWDYNVDRWSGTPVVEVDTGKPMDYVRQRLSIAAGLVQSIFMGFRDARKCFQAGNMQGGNQSLITSVNDLKAFFEWYAALKDLVPAADAAKYDITTHVDSISTVCKRICQQQLYQSWWALGETLGKDLEPALDKLEDFFRRLNLAQ